MTIKHQFVANVLQLSSKHVKKYNYLVFETRKIIQSDKTTIHNLSQVLIIQQSFHFQETLLYSSNKRKHN